MIATSCQSDISRIALTQEEIRSIRVMVNEISTRFRDTDDCSFINEISVYAHELPRQLRSIFTDFRLTENPAVLILSGYPIDEEKIGLTPAHWLQRPTPSPAFEEEIALMLFGALLGDAIAWSTQQIGRVVHDVLPIESQAHEQLGTGSEELLWWHTEDAFHEMRGDYIGMLCLRNPDRVATTVYTIDRIPTHFEDAELLFEPHFTIRPDESHLRKNNPGRDAGTDVSFNRIEDINRAPKKVAVLSGLPDDPYLRIDPYFMDPSDNLRAQRALERLIRHIDDHLQDVVLEPSDLCFIDNYRAVHGRKPFKGRFDGSDRWLKRINITRDLRKSRAIRNRTSSRVLY